MSSTQEPRAAGMRTPVNAAGHRCEAFGGGTALEEVAA
jgi:hypothetical protein